MPGQPAATTGEGPARDRQARLEAGPAPSVAAPPPPGAAAPRRQPTEAPAWPALVLLLVILVSPLVYDLYQWLRPLLGGA